MGWTIIVFLGACSYGVLSTIVKFAYDAGFTVDEVTGCQLLIAALLSWLLVLFFGGKQAGKKEWLSLLATGLCTGLTGIFYYASLQYMDASLAIIMLFQFTWIGMLVESLLSKTWPEPSKLAALVLLLTGTVLASGVIETQQQFSLLGVLLGLMAAISYTFFILLSGRIALRVSSWSRNAIMMTGAMLMTFLVYPPRFLYNGALAEGLWLYGAGLALFVLISILCFTFGVPRIGSMLALILGSAELPTAVLMSRFVLQEQVTGLQWMGVIIILLGIAVPELVKQRMKGYV